MPSTPTLQAALDALQNQDAAVGYSVSYPLGVAAPILCMYVYMALFKPRIEPQPDRRIQPVEVTVRNAALSGTSFPELRKKLPGGVQVVAIRDARQNRVPTPSTIVEVGHVLLIVGTDPAAIEQARQLIGEGTSGQITGDRSTLDYIRVYASKRSVVGMPLGRLTLPGGFEHSYIHVRRGDTDLLPDDGPRAGIRRSRRRALPP